MYIILGGAHNGKRRYVEQLIAKSKQVETIYCDGFLPEINQLGDAKRIVISQFEKIVKPFLHIPEEVAATQITEQILALSKQAEVYCICQDMSRGVVPLEKETRQMRDTSGRVYQKLCAEANTVVRVWYGIAQQLKGENHD